MWSKSGAFYVLMFFIFVSCSRPEKFPVRLSEKVTPGSVILNKSVFTVNSVVTNDSVQKSDFGKELNELLLYRQLYENRDEKFDLTNLENLWNNIKKSSVDFNAGNVSDWIEITGFLLEITGKEKYAGELENVLYQSSASFSENEMKTIEKQLVPYIFTKNVDHIHVNLFVNAAIKYNHTLDGMVEIIQETDYPESGKILIKFKMENKRYIELFIRIPEWAEGATVVEKGVKYVANPGSYCQIARKWSEGNVVEINLPIEKMPKR
jgi:hypothetical protein